MAAWRSGVGEDGGEGGGEGGVVADGDGGGSGGGGEFGEDADGGADDREAASGSRVGPSPGLRGAR
ncbi:MAG: hypothetical protein U0232_13605 [Thermomicrobiales bacterium]